MQLTHHDYARRAPARYFVDGKRVCRDRYELMILIARIANKQHSSFLTVRRKGQSGRMHYVHYSSIN